MRRHNQVNSFLNVTKLFSLVIICHILVFARADASSGELITNESTRSIQENSSEVGSKLLEIRRLLKQLFFDWNSKFGGESEIAGAVGRTFGRIRLIRQMILPLTFFGGFLTAIILFTAKTGIINMILIKGVLLLQIALIVGKMAYAAKELLTHKAREVVYYPQPSSYIPTPHSSYGPSHPPSYGWNRRQEEVFKDYNPSPINTYTQASPYYYNQQSPQKDYGQPQFSSGRSLTKRSSDNNSQLIISSQEDNQILTDSSMTTHLQNRQQILPLGIMIGRRRFVNQ